MEEVNSEKGQRDSDMKKPPSVFSLYIGNEEKGV